MSFQIVGENTAGSFIVAAQGEISNQTPAVFQAFLSENIRTNAHWTIWLDSGGGGVLAATELGRLFRKIGATVIVAQTGSGYRYAGGSCLSACVYALMGGRKRVVPLESQVGVHRMFVGNTEPQFGDSKHTWMVTHQDFAARLETYASSMGVNRAVVALAEHTPTEGFRALSREEMSRWHLAVPN